MKVTKIILGSLYTLIVVCIGIATVIEKYRGTGFVGEKIYGAWWFSVLWAVLTVAALAYIIGQRLYRRLAVLLLHLSLVVILAGALVTHLFAERGTVRLRTGLPETFYISDEHRMERLPFTLTLKEFRIIYYPGTDAPLDYQSVVQFTDDSLENEVLVSMNHIGSISGYRLFQQRYDSDDQGVTLGLSHDPWGIAITYAGYLLLLTGIIATLLSRKTQMRSLCRRAVTAVLLMVSIGTSAAAEGATGFTPQASLPSVPADIAHRLGTVHVLYNNRICPLNTVATDFTMKLTGSASWKGYSADEVFFSWMIYYSPWEKAILGDPTPQSLPAKEGSGYPKADEKRAIVGMFYSGEFLRIFPYRLTSDAEEASAPLPRMEGTGGGSSVSWFSPGAQVLPREIPVKEQFFVKQSMDFLTEAIVTGQRDRALEIIAKIKLFQREMAGDVLPGKAETRAEIFYNALRSQKWPVFLALTLSLLLCVLLLTGRLPFVRYALSILDCALWLYVTLLLALRWWLSGHIPVSNGPETMLFMAWAMLLLPALWLLVSGLRRKESRHASRFTLHLILAFAPLIASFCLLVALLGSKGAEITPLMPVLQSPLLSIHVMTVMCAYALFALQMLLGIYALALTRRTAKPSSPPSILHSPLERVTALSQLLLYPAVFLLTVGIFLGAVWANVSWGNYWSWDPKEAWALITMMVYAVPLHRASIPAFRTPRFYHTYIIGAFLAVLITYFGVNYLLGGMHSYA